MWIPYLNAGTTIGLFGSVIKMGRGEIFSPTEIFNPDYRRQMGEFFLVGAFITMGVLLGFAFVVIPGVVIGIAWSFAPLLVLDKKMNPSEALQESNNYTYGHKATIFFGQLILMGAVVLALLIGGGILAWIAGKISSSQDTLVLFIIYVVVVILYVAGILAAASIGMGSQAYIYHTLVENAPAAPARGMSPPLSPTAPGAPPFAPPPGSASPPTA